MFTTIYRSLAIVLLLAPVTCALGQAPGGDGHAHDGRQHGFGGFSMPKLPFIAAIDANGDGDLSAEELKKASESLKKLDKNNDGKLTSDELGWPPAEGPGGPDADHGFGSEREERKETSLADVLLKRDSNGDKKVTAQELPKSMGILIALIDMNNDGAIDRKEIDEFMRSFERGKDKPGDKIITSGNKKF